MKFQQVIGRSEQIVGLIQQKWGELTHNQFGIINGRRKALLGKIRELHAVADALSRRAKKFGEKAN